jgi:hypothetical protein
MFNKGYALDEGKQDNHQRQGGEEIVKLAGLHDSDQGIHGKQHSRKFNK